MKRGNTEVDTLHLNGWGMGDILENTSLKDLSTYKFKILITCVGQEKFLCRWDYGRSWENESSITSLNHGTWKKVGEDKSLKRSAGFWGRFASKLLIRIHDLERDLKNRIIK